MVDPSKSVLERGGGKRGAGLDADLEEDNEEDEEGRVAVRMVAEVVLTGEVVVLVDEVKTSGSGGGSGVVDVDVGGEG